MEENKLENLKFIYGEACKSHEQQQRDIEHLNNKFNWIITLDVVALFFIFNDSEISNDFTIVLIFFSISLVFSILSLWARTYKRGPKLTEMMQNIDWDNEKMIKNTNQSLIRNIDSNYIAVKELKLFLKIAIIFSMIGIAMLISEYI